MRARIPDRTRYDAEQVDPIEAWQGLGGRDFVHLVTSLERRRIFEQAVDALLDVLFRILRSLKSRAGQQRVRELGQERLQWVEPRAVHRGETESGGFAVVAR